MLFTSMLAISLPMDLLRSRSRLGRMALEKLRSMLLITLALNGYVGSESVQCRVQMRV